MIKESSVCSLIETLGSPEKCEKQNVIHNSPPHKYKTPFIFSPLFLTTEQIASTFSLPKIPHRIVGTLILRFRVC